MVGTKLRNMKWSGVNSTVYRGANTGRCLNWGNVQWNLNRGDVVCPVNGKSHKFLRTFSHKTGYTNILENREA